MDYQQYQQLFDEILHSEQPQPPYDHEGYLNYTKLNQSRMNRWDKLLKLDDHLIQILTNINTPLHWVIITEPWCGDAAHSLPFMIRMIALNKFFTYELQLRDSPPFLIESYLTNGSKSIPKLVVRTEDGNDLFTWGPRPKPAQELHNNLIAAGTDFQAIKINLQQWYNEDKGVTLCHEIAALFTNY
jgi:hypothetical protein